MTERLHALDLFAGPGGWDLGARELGIDPLGVEWDEAACATREAAGLRTHRGDVAALDPLDFAPCDLLIASPPCQAWSMAGKRQGQEDIERVYALTAQIASASRRPVATPGRQRFDQVASETSASWQADPPVGGTRPPIERPQRSPQASSEGAELDPLPPRVAKRGAQFPVDGAGFVGGDPPRHQVVGGSAGESSSLNLVGRERGMGGLHSDPFVGVDDVKIPQGLDDVKGWADPRSRLVTEPLRWALALRPRFIACEQVPPVLDYWHHVASILAERGYSTWTGILSAERYGVPQTRKRAILLASLDGPVHPPLPTHQEYRAGEPAWDGPMATLEGELKPWVSMAEALGWNADVPAPTVTAGGGESGGPEPFGRGGRTRIAAHGGKA